MRQFSKQIRAKQLRFFQCPAGVSSGHPKSNVTVGACVLAALLLLLIPYPVSPGHAQAPKSATASEQSNGNWVLTWSDEFDGPDASAPDKQKWNLQTGGSGWGNDELQYYTSRRQNSRLEKGNLVIETAREGFTGPDGIRRNYTSARLTTEHLFSQKYGRFEARIQVPSGQGVWPAFWLIGDDFPAVGWPECGEIDVMENIGREPGVIHGSIHGPGYSGRSPLTTAYTLSQGKFSDGFHIFAVEWEPREIRFYVDGELFATKRAKDIPAGSHWVFDHPFFIVLNLAVGGHFPGSPDKSTTFPQRMLVDYVRVYQRK